MLGGIARAIFGSQNDRIVKGMQKHIDAINNLEVSIASLSDEALQKKTAFFRKRLAAGETVDNLMEEAFAVVRESAKRILGQRHFDVQILGGIFLHQGRVTEIKTGEGKTLVATLPAYLNALPASGVHVVTVNDYLAQRDAAWMGKVYNFLGLTVGCIVHDLEDRERKAAYACDITYGTNNEFGFDYLRDNMKFRLEDMTQRDFHYALVDEVDSILIDEARTPLIISGPAEDNLQLYSQINELILYLEEDHYEKDEKQRTIILTDKGTDKIELLLSNAGIIRMGTLYDVQNISLVHQVNQALRAHKLFSRDTDYIVKNNRVVIIDEFTGRAMDGRRYSDGLHQALEAKERVAIQNENQTMASITFQNYFRLYPKLAGMTGTAMTEASEFQEIYQLEVVAIPTSAPVARIDEDDEVYRTIKEKYEAVVETIEKCRNSERPVLVGTISIENSEAVSRILKQRKIPHKVLNARFHEQESRIIAQAGRPGSVTIATNMAGRGTDIQLGGNIEMCLVQALEGVYDESARLQIVEKVTAEFEANKNKALAAGGLYVIATERHESRRIDNQLRGRSGRQGDPGRSKFFLSLEDDLMRIFGSELIDGMLQKFGLQEGEAVVHPWINKALAKAQHKVEVRNFEIRKQLLKFDDVMNDQRKIIYEQRREIMRLPEVHELVIDMRNEAIDNIVSQVIEEGSYSHQWDFELLCSEVQNLLGITPPLVEWAKEEFITKQDILERVREFSNAHLSQKDINFGSTLMRIAEKQLLLHILDQLWKDHLLSLDYLRQGISLRAYAQRDPLNEYKREAFCLFEKMLTDLRSNVTSTIAHLEIRAQSSDDIEIITAGKTGIHRTKNNQLINSNAIRSVTKDNHQAVSLTDRDKMTTLFPHLPIDWKTSEPNSSAVWGNVQRNKRCPCGSGKKYKHCHGRFN
ncbi:preprotein translocase, SecA subunit [Candidatus Endolissoclinum faulkneri L2]|uniref:Protein translocase subunit SecA n=1 Tax=Candidatus Endolissoclinum faulkneri L2 TaxID=1193729 RepID=K7Z619_9PROT|nr:preprotein translocase subunit SecA [Candidatus Endolissoclinum faulkneri]AFX99583.1 preprotein translocase, SecA subunit [Candidatus Endolissoclinum faulkneri L2]